MSLSYTPETNLQSKKFLSNKANKMLHSLSDYDDKTTNRREKDRYMLSALGKN